MNTACFLPYVGLGTCLLHMSYIREFAKKNGPVIILTFSKNLADALKFDQDVEEVIVVEKYNKKVFIVGSKNKQQLYDYYRRAIAMLFFSHKEGTPNVVLEAISFNCPIIYRNEDEVVGWILSGGGIKGLTYDVVPSLQYLNQISKSGDLRERALDFDIKVIAMKTKKMYSDMVGEELWVC